MDNILSFTDRLIASSTPAAPAWNVEHVLEKKAAAWNYVDGCMVKAVLDLFHATREKKYFDFAKSYIDEFLLDDGILGYKVEDYNCDNINMGKALFTLYDDTKDEKYKKAIELLYSQLVDHPRTESGNFWHKLMYKNQIWLDGLYMVQPFYAAYTSKFAVGEDKHTFLDDIIRQFVNVDKLMKDKETGLLYHGYDEARELFWADKETGLSKNFWTRSIGWYAMALVDTLEIAYVLRMKAHLESLAESLLKFMDNNMFYQVTNAGAGRGNYFETSGTCAIAYAFMKGARLDVLDEKYFDIGKEIFETVRREKLVLDEERFELRDICLVAGLGGYPGKGDYQPRDGTFEYYVSEPKVNNDAKGVAPFLFAYSEILFRNWRDANC
ncbi:MAG: glycoside hydrolase family 88 protein [Turicibacter sp.]|nr:glycoside hydrolase family 88 protein [Turicibacter sp.]